MRPSALLFTCLLLSGCGGPKAYVREGFLEHPPQRVAVLPFVMTYQYDLGADESIPDVHRIGRDTLRKTFYYGLTTYGYEDIPLDDVDAKLAAAWGPVEEELWRQATPQLLGRTLGADAVIMGDIHRMVYFATPIYTQVSLAATLRMIDTKTGEELWRQKVKVAERGGAAMQKGQVVDFIKDQARSFHPEVKFLRISDAAVRQVLKQIPNPTMTPEQLAAQRAQTTSPESEKLRMAVLPFSRKNGWEKGAEGLRHYLAANLQASPFEIIELQQVDAALRASGWEPGTPVPDTIELTELAHAIDADVLMRGTVTTWGRSYWVVQSSVKAGLKTELIDASTGQALWSADKKNSRSAGILKGPTGYKSLVTAPISGMKSGHLDRVANHLTRDIVEEFNTSPAVLTYVSERKSPQVASKR